MATNVLPATASPATEVVAPCPPGTVTGDHVAPPSVLRHTAVLWVVPLEAVAAIRVTGPDAAAAVTGPTCAPGTVSFS